MKLCCILERLETDGAPVDAPAYLPMTLEVPQLELANVLDEYVRAENPDSSLLLHRLRDVANEMQIYGDGKGKNTVEVYRQVGEFTVSSPHSGDVQILSTCLPAVNVDHFYASS